jgi:release factor glutamine methyltransferase
VSLAARLRPVAGEAARTEARWLIEAAGDDAARLEEFVTRRLAGEPVDRIVGSRGFWTIELTVTTATLSPRPDTETIVRAARDMVAMLHPVDSPLRFLDLGTGTGAILLALLDEFPNATGVGVDISREALRAAQDNAIRLQCADRASFIEGGWDAALGQRFDLVVSNPPYIPTADIADLDREVRDHDPHLALDGGADGLTAYRDILPLLPDLLDQAGFAALEIGFGQDKSVPALAAAAGLQVLEIRPDLGGVPRALVLALTPPPSPPRSAA